MRPSLHDTIFAMASGVGKAALAVLRVSGPECSTVLTALCPRLPPPRRASLRRLHTADGVLLDTALVLWFPGPNSFTGEDSFELHLHGGAAVHEGVMAALAALGGRPAEPGEFSRRAVSHGRMDLLEAEAVADLIDAETALQRDQALKQMGGTLSVLYRAWSTRLLHLLAHQEALIDFPDEDLPPETDAAMRLAIATLAQECTTHLAEGRRGERLRSGLVFAVAGSPNSGKSTLINALCQRDIAIVSPIAGTTRDVLEARVEIAGVPVTLLDTAGLRDSDDPLEAEGIRRARARLETADLILALHPATQTASHPVSEGPTPVLDLRTMSDLNGPQQGEMLAISALTGDGMAALLVTLENHTKRLTGSSGAPVFTRARHRVALEQAVAHLNASLQSGLAELRGEELRLALNALGRITGAVSVEEVLDSVFSQFCIGK